MQPITTAEAHEPFQPVRCPACDHWLLSRRGGGEQELPCKCKRLIRILAGGRAVVHRDLSARAQEPPAPAPVPAPPPTPAKARARAH